jgi:hypothetical protein
MKCWADPVCVGRGGSVCTACDNNILFSHLGLTGMELKITAFPEKSIQPNSSISVPRLTTAHTSAPPGTMLENLENLLTQIS